eukprot:3923597-Prymnesium_polylepis.1
MILGSNPTQYRYVTLNVTLWRLGCVPCPWRRVVQTPTSPPLGGSVARWSLNTRPQAREQAGVYGVFDSCKCKYSVQFRRSI